MTTRPSLTIVIPAYNEEARIDESLRRVAAFLDRSKRSAEVIVVDDGSSDDTASKVERVAADDPRIGLLRLPRNRGKGAAVRTGMLAASGNHVLFSDADLSTPLSELARLEAKLEQGFDIAIGSRGLRESDIQERQPFYREAMGRTFNRIVRSVLLDGFSDTQCGFKLFPRRVARRLFGFQEIDGFAFDVEVLLLAKDLGYSIAEVPVEWYHAPNSKVSPITDSSRMLSDLLWLRGRRLLRGPIRT